MQCHKQYTFIIIFWTFYENIYKTVQLKPIRVTLLISTFGYWGVTLIVPREVTLMTM